MPKVLREKNAVQKRKVSRQNEFFKKKFNHHVLDNPLIIQSIIDKADIRSTDVVLEVDPCIGNLTVKLLENARKVIAYEIDPKMVAELHKRVMGTPMQTKLQLSNCDVTKSKLPVFDLCISNVPHQISYKVLVKILLHRPMFRCAILMFQKEFADNLVAQPGDENYSRFSVNTQLYARVEILMTVEKSNFKPQPKLDSRVVRIELRNPQPNIIYEEWDGLTRVLFHKKKKTLSAIFKQTKELTEIKNKYARHCRLNNIHIPDNFNISEKVDDILSKHEIAEMRAPTMTIDDFIRVYTALKNEGIYFYWYL